MNADIYRTIGDYVLRDLERQDAPSLARYAVDELGLHRVYAEPYASNPASARVLEKAGFTCEGILVVAPMGKNLALIPEPLFNKDKGRWADRILWDPALDRIVSHRIIVIAGIKEEFNGPIVG